MSSDAGVEDGVSDSRNNRYGGFTQLGGTNGLPPHVHLLHQHMEEEGLTFPESENGSFQH